MHRAEHELAVAGQHLDKAATDCEAQAELCGEDAKAWRAVATTARDLAAMVTALASQSHDYIWDDGTAGGA